MIGTTKSKGQKDDLDKFYTKDFIAEECISLVDLGKYDLIIEPSAGSGSFSNKIKNCLAFDLEPEGKNIKKADWFKVDKSDFTGEVLVIGNPPFGVQGKLAVDFFNESAKFAKTIAFILPLSFKKNSVQNRIDLNFHLEKEFILPKNSFTLNGEDYNVPSVFQVWTRRSQKRKKIRLPLTSEFFDFVTKEEADIRIPRVGGSTGVASLSLEGAKSSNYFIKNNSWMSDREFVEMINKITFPSISYTVGPKSLPKGELVYEVEKYLEELKK